MQKGIKCFLTLVTLIALQLLATAQVSQQKVVIDWLGIKTVSGFDNEPINVLFAPGLANVASKNYSPEYFKKTKLPAGVALDTVLITHVVYETLSPEQQKSLTFKLLPCDTLSPKIETGTERGISMLMITLNPLVSSADGSIMRLKSFQIDIVFRPDTTTNQTKKAAAYASHSVLAQGGWYKIQLNKTGIYKITYSDIQAMGVNMAEVKPENIRLFGNGGGLLPEANITFRHDDLTENAIKVVSANANVFAPGDYLLFYGTSPNKIEYNKTTKKFEHIQNIYSDYTYYYLNFDGGTGLRIEDQYQSILLPTYVSTSFVEGVFYEKDLSNLIISGKNWVGERFDANNNVFQLPRFEFQNINPGKQAWIRYRLLARANLSTTFDVKVNGKLVSSPSISAIGNYNFASERIETKSFIPETGIIDVAFEYKGTGVTIGWLDWVELNITHQLKFTGGQMAFADPISVANSRVTEFQLQASSANVSIWEVTNPVKVSKIVADLQGDVSKFVLPTDSLRQFVAWDNSAFLTATFAGKIANQDLHGIAAADFLIVTNQDFLEQANRLANHHRVFDGMKVEVVTNEQVYNEFSSGSPDVAAIRDFARMLYQKPDAKDKLRYLLLFGDGSYDYKDKIANNTNKVLAFETKESEHTVYSCACDDFFGQLDVNEGYDASGLIDIGIGRFPVNTPEQAKAVVDKCIHYATNSVNSLGDWRNKICLTADDGDGNYHFGQAEHDLAPFIEKIDLVYNLNKIYVDSFKQTATATGERCPDANTAINANVENGVLIMNYTGHGGETGWANEGILSVKEIEAWTNFNNMPLFMTATCEFSRFDDPNRISAGEHVLLNPFGGGVALFTTTRLASSGPNIRLNLYFYDSILSHINGEYPRFGDVIAYSKNQISGDEKLYIRNFVLLGDPALQLAYPKNQVITTQINGRDLKQGTDTISAMEAVEIKGIIADQQSTKLSWFNGIIDVKVFDKERTLMTLGFDPDDWPEAYTVQDNYIYQGKATVTNGDFTVNFIVPRDIDYSYGFGKISYYAHDSLIDANGFCKQLVIGGSGIESTDTEGPQIALFFDDINFIDGGITGDSPLLIAQLSDVSGINTVSNGIGHDIVATLDGDNSSSIVLNSYYNAKTDSYTSGVVLYKLAELTEGEHTLSLKAWDVFNNSSSSTIRFKVSKNRQITITKVNVSPNPFNESIKVTFEINLADSPVEAYLEVFNVNGSLVSTTNMESFLAQGFKVGGLTWDGQSDSGATVPPGVYIISIRASSGNSKTVKAVKVIKTKL
jgi:flagellar hook assembly protein FlgD